MSKIVTFFSKLFGSHGQNQASISPEYTLAAIDSGILVLRPEDMKGEAGAEALMGLVAHVCSTTEAHIRSWDKQTNTDRMGSYEAILDRLLESGANPWMTTQKNEFAFERAMAGNWEFAALKFLQHPAAPKKDLLGDGGSAGAPWIVRASGHDMRQMLKILLPLTTNPSAPNTDGINAMHRANSSVVVEMLLKTGVDDEALDNNGKSPEHHWANLVKHEVISMAEQQKMMGLLVLHRVKDGDPKILSADLVANAGPDLGVRDGSSILKKAGWKDPRTATTSEGLTIFAVRSEERIGNLFRDHNNESMITSSEYFARLSKNIAWMSKGEPPERDIGLARISTWMLQRIRSESEMSAHRFVEVADQEQRLGLPTDINPQHQRMALDALTDAVKRGTITNGSSVAAMTLAGLLAHPDDKACLFDSSTGQEPLLIQWLQASYKSISDPAWAHPGAPSNYTRPDIPLRKILTNLDNHLPEQGHSFWDNPALPGLFFLIYGSITTSKKESLLAPLSPADYPSSLHKTFGRLGEQVDIWMERMNARNIYAETLSNPVSAFLLERMKDIRPGISSIMERVAMDQASPQAAMRQKRRSL